MFKRRLIILFLLFLIFFAVIIVRLVQLQVFAHYDYLDDAERIMLRPPVLLPSVRGRVLDRNGLILADNIPCFTIGIHYGAISLDDKYIDRLARNRAGAHLGKKLRRKDPTPHDYIQQVKTQIAQMWLVLPSLIPLPAELATKTYRDEQQETDAKAKFLKDRRLETIDKIQRWRDLAKAGLKKRLRDAQDDWLDAARSQAISKQIESLVLREEISFVPMVFGLDNDTARRIQTHLNCPEWLTLIPATQRVYPYGYVASRIIGSIGPLTKDDLDKLAKGPEKSHLSDPYRRYAADQDVIGRGGVERGYDWQVLRGSRGLQQKDRLGNLVRGANLPPERGKDLHLTIDIALQADLERTLAEAEPESAAAAVIIDVASGAVLAMASTPLCSRPGSKVPSALSVDGDNSWMNRCVEAAYPPGSTVKPAVILAGLSPRLRGGDRKFEPPVITPETLYHCPTGSDGFSQPRCGHSHGSVNPRKAITESCNVYCATVAELLGLDMLISFVNIGLVGPTGLHLPREHPGRMPGLTSGVASRLPAFEARQIGIGQGKIAVTPLHVANMMAAIARRGVYVPPSISIAQTRNAGSLDLNFASEHISLVIEAMEAVVHQSGGTAHGVSKLRATGLRIAGKTGTAQYGPADLKDYRCWFAGFAPVDQPQVAFAVVIEHGKTGARQAGPIAADLLNLCMEHNYITKTD